MTSPTHFTVLETGEQFAHIRALKYARIVAQEELNRKNDRLEKKIKEGNKNQIHYATLERDAIVRKIAAYDKVLAQAGG